MKNTDLEIGRNYREIFGLSEGNEMIFNGGDSWTAKKTDGAEMTMESPKTTAAALEYLNKASISMGTM